MFSLRTRLTILYGGLILTSSSLAVSGVFWGLHNHWVSLIDRDLEYQYGELEKLLDGNLPIHDPSILEALIGSYVNGVAWEFFFQIHTNTQGVVFSSANLGGRMLPDLTVGLSEAQNRVLSIGEIRVIERYLGALHVQVAVPVARYAEVEHRFVGIVLWGGPFLIMASVGLGWLLSRYSLRPLDQIFQTARKIGDEDLSQRIELPSGKDELHRLAVLLNDTFSRLEKSFGRTQQFVANAAHELKTPLAVMRLQSERLIASKNVPQDVKEELEDQLASIADVSEVIERLLVLSRAESGVMPVELVAVKIKSFLEDFAEDCRLLAEEKSIEFKIEVDQDGVVNCDPKWLRQALLNVLANAVRHSPEGSQIVLESSLSDVGWRIRVCDEGPGVPENQLHRLFERFYKAGSESEALQTSSGLGLAISKSLVELQGGEICCENRKDRTGLVVKVMIPRHCR